MAAQAKPLTKTKRKPYKLDGPKVEQLRDKGLTITEIAQHQNVTPTTVYNYLVKYTGKKERLERTRDNMAGLLLDCTADNLEILHLINQDFIENYPELRSTMDWRLKKEWKVTAEGGRHYNYLDYRLETDQTTQNIGSVHADVAEMMKLQYDEDQGKNGNGS